MTTEKFSTPKRERERKKKRGKMRVEGRKIEVVIREKVVIDYLRKKNSSHRNFQTLTNNCVRKVRGEREKRKSNRERGREIEEEKKERKRDFLSH